MEWVPVTADSRAARGAAGQHRSLVLTDQRDARPGDRKSRSRFRSSRAAIGRCARGCCGGPAPGARAKDPTMRPVWRGSPAAKVLEDTTFAVVSGTTTETWLESGANRSRSMRRSTPVPDYRTGLQQLLRPRRRCVVRRALARARRDGSSGANRSRGSRSPVHARDRRARARARRRRLSAARRPCAEPDSTRPSDFPELYHEWFGEFDDNARTFFLWNTLARVRSQRSNAPKRRFGPQARGVREMIQRSIKRLPHARARRGRRARHSDGRGPRRADAGGGATSAAPSKSSKRTLPRTARRSSPRTPRSTRADRLDARRTTTATSGHAPFCSSCARATTRFRSSCMAERGEASAIPVEVMEMVDEFIWTLEDTAAFVGGRVVAAIRRYLEVMLPPLAAALMKFTQEYEYSWHTPGHAGGTAFLKSPVGRIFFDYFGENLLRSDLSISVGSLGSLLDHTGPIGEHEKYAARVFGAHRTYCVTNGTSMSNRVIFMAAVGRDQIALCDRNCHKSIEHSLVMTGRYPDLSRAAAQPLRNHRSDPARAARRRKRSRPRSRPIRWCRRASKRARSIPSSRTRRTTGCATTRGAWKSCSIRASTASISTKPGTRTRASIRSIAIATRCTAIRRITRVRRCSPRTRRTSCWPRYRRRRFCTSATGAARSRIRASTSRSCCMRRHRRCTRSSSRTTSRPR